MRPRRGTGARPVAVAAAALLAFLGACAGEGPPAGTGEPAVQATPPGTDVWLARLVRGADGALQLLEPRNVTDRPGYDNQPAFLPDGSGFYYTVIDEGGQADIWRYDLEAGLATAVTRSAPESEYSGTPLPDGSGFSAVRVEADSTQRLWRFGPDGSGAEVLLAAVAPVGYHAWVGADTLVLFVLGDPVTLQVASRSTGVARVVAEDIGRSLQPIPGTGEVSWVQNVAGITEIRSLDPHTGASETIVAGVAGGDFHAWTPDGILLQADGARLLAFRPGSDAGWVQVADLGELGLTLSRIAVHPDGEIVALVAETAGGG